MPMRALLLLCLLLVGCATQRKDLASCQMNIEQQNDALNAEVRRRFGNQANGYNVQVEMPRARDARGHIVLRAYRIYPVVLPEPELRPDGRRLTVVIDPCTRKVVSAFEPV
jgi:hypothetical protein